MVFFDKDVLCDMIELTGKWRENLLKLARKHQKEKEMSP